MQIPSGTCNDVVQTLRSIRYTVSNEAKHLNTQTITFIHTHSRIYYYFSL